MVGTTALIYPDVGLIAEPIAKDAKVLYINPETMPEKEAGELLILQ